ncbi:MAG: YfiR family protein [Pedosphaera sp.]|nr:YfiR family protein [Pedosphaera sp.]
MHRHTIWFCPSRDRPLRSRLYWHDWIALFAVWLWLAPGGTAQAQMSHEYQIKAVFLYNFSRFSDWPPEAFASPEAPLVIGVLGKDPFGPYLEQAVRGETVNNRPIIIEHYRRVEEVKTVHILFISDSETKRLPAILARLSGRSILTVSDIDNFVHNGGMVRFITINNRIQLRINLDALKAARLTMSSKVLRAADVISSDEK